jgi:hypothetical protein
MTRTLERVGSARRTGRAFRAAVLTGGEIPVELVRARLRGEPPSRDHLARWRFAGDVLAAR